MCGTEEACAPLEIGGCVRRFTRKNGVMPSPASAESADIHTARIPVRSRPASGGRTFVIGDVHGCLIALDVLLQELAPGHGDTLVMLGDYVDRGPDSCGVLERLLELERTLRLVPLLGNHEILMIDAHRDASIAQSWYTVGGRQTMQSYGCEDDPDWSAVPAEHWEFLERRLRRWHETSTHIFAHANVNAMLPMSEQPDDWLFWRRFDDSHPHFSGKTMICGHTAQKSGLPQVLPGRLCIDTWAYGEGWLTGMDVATDVFVQTNQRGEVRRYGLEQVRHTDVRG